MSEIFNDLSSLYVTYFGFDENIYEDIIETVKPKSLDFYLEYDFDTAEQLFNAIAYDSILYKSKMGDSYKFLYRGHSDYNWKLQPAAYRDDIFDKFYKQYNINNSHFDSVTEAWFHISKQERQIFSEFVCELDKLGIPIDQELYQFALQILRGYRGGVHPLKKEYFPWFKIKDLGTLALAQHYSMSTRLLDFTKNPYKALFFAAANSVQDNENEEKGLRDKKICIWLIPEIEVIVADKIGRINYIQIPKGLNKNMRAQEGVFINYIKSEFPYNKNYLDSNYMSGLGKDGAIMSANKKLIKEFHLNDYWDDKNHLLTLDQILFKEFSDEPIDKIFNGVEKIEETHNIYRDFLNKAGKPRLFTLPYSQSKDLLNRLEVININWTTIMPSYDGIKRQIDLNRKLKSPVF